MTDPAVLPVTDATFDDVVMRSPTPVLLDFGATWCPPCRAMDPHVAALATQYAGRVTIAACDVDHNPDVATRYGIQSAPTFVLVHQGKVLDRVVGAVPRSRLDAILRRALGE